MKRTELKRKTPLKAKTPLRRAPMRRTASTLKRTPLRRMSARKRKAIDTARPGREAFACEFPTCMHCRRRRSCDTHEIPRGGHRPKAYEDRRAWLRLCRPCHDLFDNYRLAPLSLACAVKQLSDPEFYDLAWINTTRAKAETGITQAEVDAAARQWEASTN